jgi:flagellar hook-associated protein 3 FlgL
MMSNTMLLNIRRNMVYVDKLYGQISTAKKIQVPSDEPITAARALKFRSNVAETAQYQRNASQGMAWMDVTEGAYNNVINIMKSIKDRCVQAANGTLEAADRQAVATEIRQMVLQLGTEMDITYAGRYTFSGFRTNEPPVYVQDNAKRYNITQTFTVDDIEKTKSYQKLLTGSPAGTDPPLVFRSSMLKLPYSDVTNLSIPGYDVLTASVADAVVPGQTYNPYDSASIPATIPRTIVYIRETGELVMSESDAAVLPAGGLTVNYDKSGFRAGELNPIVYFDCTDLDTGIDYTMDTQDIAYEFSVNTHVNINSLAKNVYTDKMYADLNDLCGLLEGVTLSNSNQLTEKYSSPPYSLSGDALSRTVNRQAADERAQLADVLHDRFNNMLYMCDRHIANVSRQQTDLGARMNRLDLISARLEQDEGSYRKLMSDNEDADMMETIMYKSNAEAVYQASLKAGASIIQMTLSNFI